MPTDDRSGLRRVRTTIGAVVGAGVAVMLAVGSLNPVFAESKGVGSSAAGVSAAPTPSVVSATSVAAGPGTATSSAAAPLTTSQIEGLIGIPSLWQQGYTGQGVDVAEIDTGVTPVAGLNGPNKLVYGPDLSFDSQNPATTDVDGYGHGTAMAGLIAGDDGGAGGFEGAAPGARIVSVKVGASDGAADVSQIIAGIDWVVQHRNTDGLNIRVLNLSLGTDSVQPYQIDPLDHAAEVAWRAGIVVVAAGGNAGSTAPGLDDPADDPYVLAVGAEDPQGDTNPADGVAASFSSWGNSTRRPDLVAPGVDVTSLLDPGSALATEYPAAISGNRFFRGSGTSQAAALVSGGVADLLSEFPSATPDQVKAALDSSATSIAGKRLAVGNGLVNFSAAQNVGQRYGNKPLPNVSQSFPVSTGSGSIEAARGDDHVSINGSTLTGEQDIFGDAWTPAVAQAEDNQSAWSGGVWNGATWSGATWSGATWSGATWSGATWSGATWSGATWSGATWSGATWSGATWSGVIWAGFGWA